MLFETDPGLRPIQPGMSKPVTFTPSNKPSKALSVAISTKDSACFSEVVQRDFIPVLSGMINIKSELVSFQKNYFKKMFYARVSTLASHNILLNKASFTLNGSEWSIAPATSVYLNLTAHWAPDEMTDTTIGDALKPYGECLGVNKPKFRDPELAHVRTGIRIYRFKCHQVRYIPNFINFGGEVVMFTYPGQTYECRRCGQAGHKAPECKSMWCQNCGGFTPHENSHVEIECDEQCRMCSSYQHTVSECCARASSYAARVKGDVPRPPSTSHQNEDTSMDEEDRDIDVCDDSESDDNQSEHELTSDADMSAEEVDKESAPEPDTEPESNPRPPAASLKQTIVQPTTSTIRAEVHQCSSPEPVKQKKQKLADQTSEPAKASGEEETCQTETTEMNCGDMTPTPSQEVSSLMIDYRKKKSVASRGRRRQARDL